MYPCVCIYIYIWKQKKKTKDQCGQQHADGNLDVDFGRAQHSTC